jgi:spore germination cell wall hydrolase CwlJ-like protein
MAHRLETERAVQAGSLSPTMKAIIAEAANQGPEGMKRVAKVIYSRSMVPRWKGMKTDAIVSQPKQFSGMSRPNLTQFLASQPDHIYGQASKAMNEAEKELAGKPWADHYLTAKLYDDPKKRPDWAGKMKVMERYKDHVFLKE